MSMRRSDSFSNEGSTQRKYTSLCQYVENLRVYKESLASNLQPGNVVTLVLCNEGNDLDSTACALVYAYFLEQTKASAASFVLPVLNTSASDFLLRTDIVVLLEHYKILPADLLFLDDISFLQSNNKSQLRVVLVDHNYPSERCQWLSKFVVRVIDHHERLASDFPKLPETCDYTIERVGSCSTLVLEEILRSDASWTPMVPPSSPISSPGSEYFIQSPSASSAIISKAQNDGHIDSVGAALLLSAILVDTVCGSPAAGKVTLRDSNAVLLLDEVAQLPFNHGRLYDWLTAANSDLTKVSSVGILKKDSKLVSAGTRRVLLCSIPSDPTVFFERSDILAACFETMESNGTTALVLLFVSSNLRSGVKRDLVIFSREVNFRLAEHLQSANTPDLMLKPWPDSSISASYRSLFTGFSQHNVQASRKQVLPLVEAFLRKSESTQ